MDAFWTQLLIVQQVARRRFPAKRWKSLQLLLMHPRGVEPAAFGFCANEHILHKVKAPRANRPRGLHYLARPRGFEPLAFGFVAVPTSYCRRASLLRFPGFTRGWLGGRVLGRAPECTPVHARMDEIWMKCGVHPISRRGGDLPRSGYRALKTTRPPMMV